MNNSSLSESHESRKKKKKKDKEKEMGRQKEKCNRSNDHGKNDACNSIVNFHKPEKSSSWLDAFKTASEVQPIIPLEELKVTGDSPNILPISVRATCYMASSSGKRPLEDDFHSPQGSKISENSSESFIKVTKKNKKKRSIEKQKCTSSQTDHDMKDKGEQAVCLETIGSKNKNSETSSENNYNEIIASFPYPTEEDDHCESPKEAYEQIAPLLHKFSLLIGKDPSSVLIYDPYYCNGSTKTFLNSLGFDNAYHKKEDCYAVWKTPFEWDVLVTNPPYSGDHMERLLKYITATNKAWFLLAPQFYHKKDYYIESLQRSANGTQRHPFYLVPRSRYVYIPPKGFRTKKFLSDTHKKSSPFNSMWYVWAGNEQITEELIRWYYKKESGLVEWFDLARSKNALRDLRRRNKTN